MANHTFLVAFLLILAVSAVFEDEMDLGDEIGTFELLPEFEDAVGGENLWEDLPEIEDEVGADSMWDDLPEDDEEVGEWEVGEDWEGELPELEDEVGKRMDIDKNVGKEVQVSGYNKWDWCDCGKRGYLYVYSKQSRQTFRVSPSNRRQRIKWRRRTRTVYWRCSRHRHWRKRRFRYAGRRWYLKYFYARKCSCNAIQIRASCRIYKFAGWRKRVCSPHRVIRNVCATTGRINWRPSLWADEAMSAQSDEDTALAVETEVGQIEDIFEDEEEVGEENMWNNLPIIEDGVGEVLIPDMLTKSEVETGEYEVAGEWTAELPELEDYVGEQWVPDHEENVGYACNIKKFKWGCSKCCKKIWRAKVCHPCRCRRKEVLYKKVFKCRTCYNRVGRMKFRYVCKCGWKTRQCSSSETLSDLEVTYNNELELGYTIGEEPGMKNDDALEAKVGQAAEIMENEYLSSEAFSWKSKLLPLCILAAGFVLVFSYQQNQKSEEVFALMSYTKGEETEL